MHIFIPVFNQNSQNQDRGLALKTAFPLDPTCSVCFCPRRGRRWSRSGCEARKWTPCWQTETGSWLKKRRISSTCRRRCQENRASRLRRPRCVCVWGGADIHGVARRRGAIANKAVFFTPADRCLSPQTSEASGAAQELQLLVQSLTRKVGESEERYSLLQEQSESLKELLVTEKEEYTRKENMYKENVGFQRARRLPSEPRRLPSGGFS